MTEQEIFDKVAVALIDQGKRSVSKSGACRYRGPNGLKCAIGILISDDMYRKDIEQTDVVDIIDKRVLPREYSKFIPFLDDLQSAHDGASGSDFVAHFKIRMCDVAECWKLSPDILG